MCRGMFGPANAYIHAWLVHHQYSIPAEAHQPLPPSIALLSVQYYSNMHATFTHHHAIHAQYVQRSLCSQALYKHVK